MNDQEIVRFCNKVAQDGQCWVWTGARSAKGYGRVTIRNKHQFPHRVIYEYVHGPIPDGMQIDHTCHNPSCVNPDHLRVGTQKQNAENCRMYSNNKSGYRGVIWIASRKKWRANVRHDGKLKFLGYFDTAEEAAAVAKARRNEVYTFNDHDREVQS